MSTNLTVAVPLEAFTALGQTSDPQKTSDAIGIINKAVIQSLKALPREATEPSKKRRREEDTEMITTNTTVTAAIEPLIAGSVQLELRLANGPSLWVKVQRDRPLEALMQTYANHVGLPMSSLRYLAEGFRVYPTDSSITLMLEDGDVIEVYPDLKGS